MNLFKEVKNKGASIQYLINNAGMLSKGFFEDMSNDYFLAQIKVNVTTPTLLTKLFLNDLKQNSPSGILNVSSMASFSICLKNRFMEVLKRIYFLSLKA